METIITNVRDLVIGKSYVVETGEPHGTFRVGAFIGWRFDIGPKPGYVNQEPELIESLDALPDDWDDRYPTCVFERAEVGDFYMFEGWEE